MFHATKVKELALSGKFVAASRYMDYVERTKAAPPELIALYRKAIERRRQMAATAKAETTSVQLTLEEQIVALLTPQGDTL